MWLLKPVSAFTSVPLRHWSSEGKATVGSTHVTCLSRMLWAWIVSRLVCKTKQVLLSNLLFLDSQNSGSSEGKDPHTTHPSFRMQCFLVLGLYLAWSDLCIGSWAGQLHQGLMDGLQASLNPLKLHGRLSISFFPLWNGSSSSYWIQKMLRMNLAADYSSRVTIVWENFCWPHTWLRCEENHGCCWDLTDKA